MSKSGPMNGGLPSAKVLIAIPSGPMWHAEFALDLLLMVQNSQLPTPGYHRVETAIRNIRGSTIWRQRADLLRGAVEMNCTHALFVDVDQIFPSTTLRRLLAHKKQIVAANVAIKQFPSFPTARKLVDGQI